MGAKLDVGLPRKRSASRLAREQLEEKFASELEQHELESAKLLASELVNNAVLHGLGDITFRAGLDDNRLRVEVIDGGSGFERDLRQRDLDEIGGWGLRLVDAEASRWGVHEGTTHVWFEIERGGPRLGRD